MMQDFGWALTQLRQGARVTRANWNGKGMWIVHQKGYPDGIPINANTASATGIPQGTVCKFLPYLMMKTAGEDCFVPWLASQTDMLATDWEFAPGYAKWHFDGEAALRYLIRMLNEAEAEAPGKTAAK